MQCNPPRIEQDWWVALTTLLLLSRIHVILSVHLYFSPGGAAGRKPWDRRVAPTSEPRRVDRARAEASVAPPGLGEVSPRPPRTQGSRPGLLTAAPPGLKPPVNSGLASNKWSRIRDSRTTRLRRPLRRAMIGACRHWFFPNLWRFKRSNPALCPRGEESGSSDDPTPGRRVSRYTTGPHASISTTRVTAFWV